MQKPILFRTLNELTVATIDVFGEVEWFQRGQYVLLRLLWKGNEMGYRIGEDWRPVFQTMGEEIDSWEGM